MKAFILFCLLVVAVSASLELQEQFQAFKLKHGKTYKNKAEETKRFQIFQENVQAIEEHNDRYQKGLVTYYKAINRFTDLTQEEFKAFLTLSSSGKPKIEGTKQHVMSGLKYPDYVDWRSSQVTGVKDQGQCGSCWAFSVTGAVEAAFERANGYLVSLSEQQLVDCTTDKGNFGCDGGWMHQTFPYVQQYGLELEQDYPYTARDGSCYYDANRVVTRVNGYVVLNSGDEYALLDAVATVGPVSVSMDASYISSYGGGVFEDYQCTQYDLNHGVLVVGYGSENGQDYWIIKNSWGSGFGENGFIRLGRGRNMCGIAQDDSYPYL